jgi:hypothetical protein
VHLGHTGFNAKAVCMPSETPSPRKVIRRTRGISPVGGGPFALSVTASKTISRIAVPRNSEKKQAADREVRQRRTSERKICGPEG